MDARGGSVVAKRNGALLGNRVGLALSKGLFDPQVFERWLWPRRLESNPRSS